MQVLPTSEDVAGAATRLDGIAVRTPVLESQVLNERVGARVFIKPEIFQHTGSFKFRGAYNRLSRLSRAELEAGVVAWSSGNHAQGVAAAAKRLGTTATIIMPRDAPKTKIERTRALGATIRFYERATEDREEIGRALARKMGAVLVPSYDDRHIIAGQGTAALELFADAPAPIDHLLVPCGGGGLTAGCVLARDNASPNTKVHTVEPQFYDDHARSFQSGERQRADISKKSLCDALLSPSPGELTFQINQHGVESGLVVTEADVISAMKFAFAELKLVIEPGGSVGLASLLAGYTNIRTKTIGLIASGGNVDPAHFARLVTS